MKHLNNGGWSILLQLVPPLGESALYIRPLLLERSLLLDNVSTQRQAVVVDKFIDNTNLAMDKCD